MFEFEEHLTGNQARDFAFLKRFFDPGGPKSTGKTYTMACVIIALAMKYPGREIHLIDHSDMTSRDMRRHGFMARQVAEIIGKMPDAEREGFTFDKAGGSLMYDPGDEKSEISLREKVDFRWKEFLVHHGRWPARMIVNYEDWAALHNEIGTVDESGMKYYRGCRVFLSEDVDKGEFIFS